LVLCCFGASTIGIKRSGPNPGQAGGGGREEEGRRGGGRAFLIFSKGEETLSPRSRQGKGQALFSFSRGLLLMLLLFGLVSVPVIVVLSGWRGALSLASLFGSLSVSWSGRGALQRAQKGRKKTQGGRCGCGGGAAKRSRRGSRSREGASVAGCESFGGWREVRMGFADKCKKKMKRRVRFLGCVFFGGGGPCCAGPRARVREGAPPWRRLKWMQRAKSRQNRRRKVERARRGRRMTEEKGKQSRRRGPRRGRRSLFCRSALLHKTAPRGKERGGVRRRVRVLPAQRDKTRRGRVKHKGRARLKTALFFRLSVEAR
jgi:hypothetical protein